MHTVQTGSADSCSAVSAAAPSGGYLERAVAAERHAGGVNLDLDALAATASMIASSAVGWEMAVRLGQSLEITDALWELVPVVVTAGERVDKRPSAKAADLSPACR